MIMRVILLANTVREGIAGKHSSGELEAMSMATLANLLGSRGLGLHASELRIGVI